MSPTNDLIPLLKKLRLSGLTPSLDVRLQEASANHLSHAEFLEILLQDELAVRQDRLIKRRTKVAAFREPKTIEDFDWQFNPAIKKKQIFDLAACKFIREARDVLAVCRSLLSANHAQTLRVQKNLAVLLDRAGQIALPPVSYVRQIRWRVEPGLRRCGSTRRPSKAGCAISSPWSSLRCGAAGMSLCLTA